jgi:hypothetical protein
MFPIIPCYLDSWDCTLMFWLAIAIQVIDQAWPFMIAGSFALWLIWRGIRRFPR